MTDSIHLDRRNIKYPLDLTMVHTEYTIEESFNIYTVTGNYVRYLLRYHSEYIKSFLWSRYNLRCFYIMPSCYVYWPRCHRPELSKALEKKSVYIFFSLNDKMLRFKKLNKLMYQRVNARFSNILQGNSFAKN